MNFIDTFKKKKWMLRSLPQTIYFNFKMLPFKQACKLPIWLYKPRFDSLSGCVKIDCPKNQLKPGMIHIGNLRNNLFPNNGCMLDIKGELTFKGTCRFGNNTNISVGKRGKLVIEDGVSCGTSLKIACYHSISFGKDVHVGWDCLFMDTDFHSLIRENGTRTRGYAPIVIGEGAWLGTGCKIFKRTQIPAHCIVSGMTILSGPVDCPERSLIGNPRSTVVKVTGIYRDYHDDKIVYP